MANNYQPKITSKLKDYHKSKKLAIFGNNWLQSVTNGLVAGNSAIVAFKILSAVFLIIFSRKRSNILYPLSEIKKSIYIDSGLTDIISEI
ncbi:MAG: hypothetical protein KME28_23340 [Pelatocladus maniniholoensis HA4357-MV3]|jgi:hypothetical protein|uniref:Uncharacterized protein n=1 Tax=Pelatocladus maniniholoensis HA4357-MV3 TaxID=1117104 RepID=A0A9E3HC74_9NOST|nr:hypothetical protein [Pelatocladus maniniholoensis HA4357-MV3]